MAGGIRPRLARLTDPDMKRFVSEGVKAASDPAGKKLMAQLNRDWANALKLTKQYDKLVDITEKTLKKASSQVADLDTPTLDEVQALINYANKELKTIVAAVGSFEKTEEALAAKYGLKRVAGR